MIRYLLLWAMLGGAGAYAQQIYRGIVVDSASLLNLPDVHVTIKGTGKVATTSSSGSFLVYAQPSDTLVFSRIGYITSELPLLFAEDALFVLLREDKIMLNEVIIKSTRLYPDKIEDRTKSAPRTLNVIEGIFSPFDYFWSLEREKRKLTKIVAENNRTQTYRQVITNPEVKKILMKEYNVSEETYYDIIVQFNQQQSRVHYFTDPDAIMESLHDFFQKAMTSK